MSETHAEHETHDVNPIVANLPSGSFAFHYTLRTKPGKAQEFLRAFHEWDHSDQNIVHKTPGMVQEGILYQSEEDEDRFYLIGIWNNRENHRRVVAQVREMRPAWLELLETPLVPEYLRIIG
jgi:quinol monooxygenase YgiN